MRKYVLVTGGLGFIGKNLVFELSKLPISVVVLDNLSHQIHGNSRKFDFFLPNVNVINGDIRSVEEHKELICGASAIIHLAAETGTGQSMYEISKYNDVNTQGTANLLDCLANNKNYVKKIILTSSRAIYGEGSYNCIFHKTVTPNPRSNATLSKNFWDPVCPICGGALSLIPTKETAEIHPASIYAATKYFQEELLRIACSSIGIPYSILRLQNVYGAGQSLSNPYTGILSIFTTRMRNNLPISVFEDGLESRDFVYVDDVTRSIIACLQSDSANGQTFNIGSGIKTTILEIANLLFDFLKPSNVCIPNITNQYRIGDIRHGFADIEKANHILNWFPEISITDGLSKFIDWATQEPVSKDLLDAAMRELRNRNLTG